MDYCYQTQIDDSFNNWDVEYFKHENLVVGIERKYFFTNGLMKINTFNISTKEFTVSEVLLNKQYHELINIDYIFDNGSCGIAIDFKNKSFAKTVDYPYFIHEIDGNFIKTCRDNDFYYIFHSITETYDTGVFIFDIKNNAVNNKDFVSKNNLSMTNKFINIHDVTVISCGIKDKNIFINGNIENNEFICKYDPMEDKLIKLFQIPNFKHGCNEIIVSSEIIYILNENNIYFYNIILNEIVKNICIGDEKESVIFFDFYDDKLVIISGNYQYLTGYGTNDSSRNLQIKMYNL